MLLDDMKDLLVLIKKTKIHFYQALWQADGELEEIEIIKNVDFLDIMEPRDKLPTGISLERQWYLYENVREHVQNPNKRDIYCPHPLLSKPRKNQ